MTLVATSQLRLAEPHAPTTVVCGDGLRNMVAWFATRELAQEFLDTMRTREWVEMPDPEAFVERRKGDKS